MVNTTKSDTVVDLFRRSASIVHFDDGTHQTASELLDDGARYAAWMHAQGVRPGDRVAVHLANGAHYVRCLLACAVGGFVAVSVNTRYSSAEVGELVVRSGAVELDGGSGAAWRGEMPMTVARRADDPFVVFTTSGTTSRPKMVLHHQRSIAHHAADAAAGFGYSSDDVALVAMPLCGTFGLTSLTAAIAGDCTVVLTEFDLARTADLIAHHGVTTVNGSDDMFHRLAGHGADLTSIRLAGYARFNTSLDHVVETAEAAGATLAGLYGMSEVQALFSLRDPGEDASGRSRSGGTLVSNDARYRIVDGELQLQGPSLMAGYLAEGGAEIDVELTAANFDGEWFRTGDLAVPDDDRTFEYVTRRGDAMRLGGFLVDPSEIESVITAQDGVEAAQVVAVDRPNGARPVAFVIGEFDEAEVIARCRDRLAIYKVPVRVVPIGEFPSTASANGTKIQRTKLREMAGALLERDG